MQGGRRTCPTLAAKAPFGWANRGSRMLRADVTSIFSQRLDLIRALPHFDLALAQIGVALVSPKEAHRVFILDILGTIYDVNHVALGTNSVTATNVLDNLLKLARHRVPITPDFNSNLVVRHQTPPVCGLTHNVHSFRLSIQFAQKEACALILNDVWTTDSDPVETFCARSPQARL
jgi:hypothetical protein